ncbi:hypothetical protein EV361DRAFT_165885 [Lentinula raphanica]|nr:hypothetical protein EV361DRAFT_165885 [Lentinula raphanica]
MSFRDATDFVIKNSQFNYIGRDQIIVHRYGSMISNEMNDPESLRQLIGDEALSIPRLAQVEVPLLDTQEGITIYGRETLFHARLRPVHCQGGWTLGGLGDDASKVVVRRLAKESSDEDVNKEIKHSLAYYDSYVMQLFGASKKGSPNKFLVYSNPSVTTYVHFKGSRQGEDYRNYDALYDQSFNSAWKYLRNEVPVDGFTLDVIFSETRTVNANGGNALVVVPALPSSPIDRTKLVTKVLEEFQSKVNRRVEVAYYRQYTRCLECLPSTSEWNLGLINSVLRCSKNVEPHLEWAKSLVQNGIEQEHYAEASSSSEQGWDEVHDEAWSRRRKEEFDEAFERANTLITTLKENTENDLNKAMNDVILRSNLASGGTCSWCGKKWDRDQTFPKAESSAFITEVVEDNAPDGSQKDIIQVSQLSRLKLSYGSDYRTRIIVLVICMLLAGALVFMKFS